MHQRLLSLKS
jgi:hypothetical protein